MNKRINMLSSDEVTIYTVDFELGDGKLIVQCDCPAGAFGKLCKHKLQLLAGDLANLANVTQEDDYREVMNWIQQSQLPNMIDQLSIVEKELEKKKTQLSILKKNLEVVLRDGVSVLA